MLALLAILRGELQAEWGYRVIGGVFEVSKGIVHRVRSKTVSDTEYDTGRPPQLQFVEKARLIADRFQGDSPVSPKQVRGYVLETFRKEVSSFYMLIKSHR
jgi:PHP family Zn ribbon phosphoesterase